MLKVTCTGEPLAASLPSGLSLPLSFTTKGTWAETIEGEDDVAPGIESPFPVVAGPTCAADKTDMNNNARMNKRRHRLLSGHGLLHNIEKAPKRIVRNYPRFHPARRSVLGLFIPEGNDRWLAGISRQPLPASFPPIFEPTTLADHIVVQEAEDESEDLRGLACPAKRFHMHWSTCPYARAM